MMGKTLVVPVETGGSGGLETVVEREPMGPAREVDLKTQEPSRCLKETSVPQPRKALSSICWFCPSLPCCSQWMRLRQGLCLLSKVGSLSETGESSWIRTSAEAKGARDEKMQGVPEDSWG